MFKITSHSDPFGIGIKFFVWFPMHENVKIVIYSYRVKIFEIHKMCLICLIVYGNLTLTTEPVCSLGGVEWKVIAGFLLMISPLPPNITPLKLLHMPILTNSFLKNSLYTVFHISLLPYECRINLWKSYYFGHLSARNQNVEVILRYGFCHKISFYLFIYFFA